MKVFTTMSLPVPREVEGQILGENLVDREVLELGDVHQRRLAGRRIEKQAVRSAALLAVGTLPLRAAGGWPGEETRI